MHETSIVYTCLRMCILQFMHAKSYSINNMIVQLASVRYIIAKAVAYIQQCCRPGVHMP